MQDDDDGGLTTVQFVAAVSLALLFFVLLANLLVVQYGRGAVRTALEEAVRAGSRTGGDPERCLEVAEDSFDQLFGGSFGNGVALSCIIEGGVVTAKAEGQLPSWFPAVPDYHLLLEARAVKEPEQ